MRGSESGPVELFYFQKWAKNIKKNVVKAVSVSVRLNINPKFDSSCQSTIQKPLNKLDTSC